MDALEKECEEWLSLLIHLVEVAEHHAIEFLSMFFKPTTTSTVATNNQDHITMEVIESNHFILAQTMLTNILCLQVCKLIEENKNVGVNQLLELFNIEALTSRLMSPPVSFYGSQSKAKQTILLVYHPCPSDFLPPPILFLTIATCAELYMSWEKREASA